MRPITSVALSQLQRQTVSSDWITTPLTTLARLLQPELDPETNLVQALTRALTEARAFVPEHQLGTHSYDGQPVWLEWSSEWPKTEFELDGALVFAIRGDTHRVVLTLFMGQHVIWPHATLQREGEAFPLRALAKMPTTDLLFPVFTALTQLPPTPDV